MFQAEEDAKGDAISDLQLGLLVGEVVYFFEYEYFEHQHDIEGVATGIGESFFLSDFVEGGSKDFPVDEGVEFRQEIVELVDFIKLFFEVEESELSFGFGHERKKVMEWTMQANNLAHFRRLSRSTTTTTDF
jgi:hypothetical protein